MTSGGMDADLDLDRHLAENDSEQAFNEITEDQIDDDDDDVDYDNTKENRQSAKKPDSPIKKDYFDEFEFAGQPAYAETSSSLDADLSSKAGTWVDGHGVCTARINKSRKFVCVDYPAIIKNTEKALATLGGRAGISKVLSHNQRLELSFCPSDPYRKPTVAQDSKKNNLLIKLRRRRKKGGAGVDSDFEYQIEVIGVVEIMFSFSNACDFQYLPVMRQENGQFKEVLSAIRPSLDDDRSEYLSRHSPLFLPPLVFSRREAPSSYSMEDDVLKGDASEDLISLRKKRQHGTIYCSFKDTEVPMEPLEEAKTNFKRFAQARLNTSAVAAVTKVFEQRPIWSKTGCMAQLNSAYHRQLTLILPLVAFYFSNGPWRNLWCKYGYDPRKHPEAKVYQVLDFRVRSIYNRNQVDLKRKMDPQRSYQLSPFHKQTETSLQRENKKDAQSVNDESADGKPKFNPLYMFSSDMMPAHRQVRYQFCDILDGKVQERLHENDGSETVCSESDGWCIPDFTNICRDILNAYVEVLLAK